MRIGGLQAEVLYAGGAPGLVAGALQVNARVPMGVTPGSAVPVLLSIGNATSQPGVTLAVTAEVVALQSVTIAPSSVTAGGTATATVRLTAASPPGGIMVRLESDNPTAQLTCTFFMGPNVGCVTVREGQTSATFTIQTRSVSTTQTATITASYAGVSRTATLTINRPMPAPSAFANRHTNIDATFAPNNLPQIPVEIAIDCLDIDCLGGSVSVPSGVPVGGIFFVVTVLDGRLVGNTVTFSRVGPSQYGLLAPEGITSVELTLTAAGSGVGSSVTGRLKFTTTSGRTLEGALSGRITSYYE